MDHDNLATERLNKFLAFNLGISRRKADELIEQQKVTVNDQTAKIGDRINPNRDQIKVRQKLIKPKADFTYVLFNKPVGFVCSRKKQGEAETIFSILPKEYRHLKTVGRLDKNSSGLIILTDDGDFTQKMTHPSFQKNKRYLVKLDLELAPLHRQMISDFGINLPDGKSQLFLTRQFEGDDKNWIVEMSEGRNRQIRRTFSALGYTVKKLHRTDFGPYSLGELKRGQTKEIKIK